MWLGVGGLLPQFTASSSLLSWNPFSSLLERSAIAWLSITTTWNLEVVTIFQILVCPSSKIRTLPILGMCDSPQQIAGK